MTEALLSYGEEGQFAWDATSLAAFEKCPRYYKWKNLEGWQPHERSDHLTFGIAYASALEKYHKLRFNGSTYEEALHEVVKITLTTTFNWTSQHKTKTRENLIRTIVWYLEEFSSSSIKPIVINEKPAVELSFTLPLNDTYLYCGHMDSVVTYCNSPYIMDQKTTGTTVGPYFFQKFTPDIQVTGYTWAGIQMFQLPIKGVIIDAAQVAMGFSRFERSFVTRSKQNLEEWVEMSLKTMEEARISFHTDTFRMNRSSCGNYGGCEFRSVCSRAPEFHLRALQADFVQQPRWDPLQKR